MKRCLYCQQTYQASGWDCPNCRKTPHHEDGFFVFAPALAQSNDSYSTEFFAELAALESGHFWFEARNRLLLWAVQTYFPQVESFCEIGCGTGFVLEQLASALPSAEISGSDLLLSGLGFAAARVPRANLFQMDACDIPFEQQFDLIGAFDVIEHIEDDELALAQMGRALRPGGGLMITVPQHMFLWSRVDDLSYHQRRYSKSELVTKVEQAGFELLHTTSFVSLLLPLMLLTRLRKVGAEAEFDFYEEFKINPTLNKMLATPMAIEQIFIRMGMRYPAGGSRLLIARKLA